MDRTSGIRPRDFRPCRLNERVPRSAKANRRKGRSRYDIASKVSKHRLLRAAPLHVDKRCVNPTLVGQVSAEKPRWVRTLEAMFHKPRPTLPSVAFALREPGSFRRHGRKSRGRIPLGSVHPDRPPPGTRCSGRPWHGREAIGVDRPFALQCRFQSCHRECGTIGFHVTQQGRLAVHVANQPDLAPMRTESRPFGPRSSRWRCRPVFAVPGPVRPLFARDSLKPAHLVIRSLHKPSPSPVGLPMFPSTGRSIADPQRLGLEGPGQRCRICIWSAESARG